jgi:hypothetical protein
MFIPPQYSVGAHLPKHQIRALACDTLVEAGEHVGRALATDAAV